MQSDKAPFDPTADVVMYVHAMGIPSVNIDMLQAWQGNL